MWVLGLFGIWATGISLGGHTDNTFVVPGVQSQEALDQLAVGFPQAAGASATIVYHTTAAGTKVTSSQIESQINASVKDLQGQPNVLFVTNPFNPSAPKVSADGTTALATVQYTKATQGLPGNGQDSFDALQATQAKYSTPQLQIELGGQLPGAQPIDIKDTVVLFGLLAALIVLLIALGTWWSFAWPVVGALVGTALGMGIVQILERFVAIPSLAETAGVMIGLGVGIDYGLFVTGRFKEATRAGAEPWDAAGRAVSTAGRASLIAGSTVVVALIALLVFDVPAVSAIALAVAVVVVSVVLAALTLQPAILGWIGKRVETGKIRRIPKGPLDEVPMGHRWARSVTRFAPWAALAGVVALLALALPVFLGDLRLGPNDNSLYPTSSTQYKAWELQSQQFGAGSPNPFLLVAEFPAGDTLYKQQIANVQKAVAATPGVAAVTTAQFNSTTAPTMGVFSVTPTTTAQAAATADLVTTLRDKTIPPAVAGTQMQVLVSGSNAVFVDLDQRIADRLGIFIGLVILIALIILMTVFRSVLVPLKAAAMNLLTILATYGVIVMVFTYGWGSSAIGVPNEVPLLSLLAPIMFALLFGLSNDYEVYLVSRMHEEYTLHEDARLAIKRGHALGSRTVIAAALIMIFVFASYIFQPGTAVKEFGLGMAAAIVIDAFIARMLILPAVMHLGNSTMWWFPRWLDRILPKVDTEGGGATPEAGAEAAGRGTAGPPDGIPAPSPAGAPRDPASQVTLAAAAPLAGQPPAEPQVEGAEAVDGTAADTEPAAEGRRSPSR
jgi:RND superfamily putative drug exporter